MAHSSLDGSEAPTPAASGNGVEDFATFLDEYLADGEQGEQEEAEEAGNELEAEADADAESDESPQDDEDEPNATAIDPPVSWGSDAKEQFAQLPVEMQQFVADREAQRERFIQQKATEAAEAKREAHRDAEASVSDMQRRYANELDHYANMFSPQPPDPALAAHDPAAYTVLKAQYDAEVAQQFDLQQRANAARQDAEMRERAIEEDLHRKDMEILSREIPDWGDVEKRREFLTGLEKVGVALGIDQATLAEASAQDILSLRTASSWKAKADKWDALQREKMAVVRSAKKLPKVVRPGVSQTRGEANFQRSQAAWQAVGSAKTKEARENAFADYLTSSGHI